MPLNDPPPFPLRCPVRKCGQMLAIESQGLTCPAGHHFDRAKQGYYSLLQPQDRKSTQPGDSEDAVMARHRWLQRGHAAGLVETLRPWIDSIASEQESKPATFVDLGCGEGYFGPALFQRTESNSPTGSPAGPGATPCHDAPAYLGIDLSKRAMRIAARCWEGGTWVLANADRELPIPDGVIDGVISLFGRRPASEIARVLRSDGSGGSCVVAIPGEDDLIELRQHVQTRGDRRRRDELVIEDMTAAGLTLAEQASWQQKIMLQHDEIQDALAMTYRGVRHSQAARAETLETATVTLAAELLWFRKMS